MSNEHSGNIANIITASAAVVLVGFLGYHTLPTLLRNRDVSGIIYIYSGPVQIEGKEFNVYYEFLSSQIPYNQMGITDPSNLYRIFIMDDKADKDLNDLFDYVAVYEGENKKEFRNDSYEVNTKFYDKNTKLGRRLVKESRNKLREYDAIYAKARKAIKAKLKEEKRRLEEEKKNTENKLIEEMAIPDSLRSLIDEEDPYSFYGSF